MTKRESSCWDGPWKVWEYAAKVPQGVCGCWVGTVGMDVCSVYANNGTVFIGITMKNSSIVKRQQQQERFQLQL